MSKLRVQRQTDGPQIRPTSSTTKLIYPTTSARIETSRAVGRSRHEYAIRPFAPYAYSPRCGTSA